MRDCNTAVEEAYDLQDTHDIAAHQKQMRKLTVHLLAIWAIYTPRCSPQEEKPQIADMVCPYLLQEEAFSWWCLAAEEFDLIVEGGPATHFFLALMEANTTEGETAVVEDLMTFDSSNSEARDTDESEDGSDHYSAANLLLFADKIQSGGQEHTIDDIDASQDDAAIKKSLEEATARERSAHQLIECLETTIKELRALYSELSKDSLKLKVELSELKDHALDLSKDIKKLVKANSRLSKMTTPSKQKNLKLNDQRSTFRTLDFVPPKSWSEKHETQADSRTLAPFGRGSYFEVIPALLSSPATLSWKSGL